MSAQVLLSARGLRKSFVTERNLFGRPIKRFVSVDDVSLDVAQGETLAIVGESGAGKSTTGRLVAGLIPRDGGTILFRGSDVGRGRRSSGLTRKIQMIFQDPYLSLDPRLSVRYSLAEPMRIHRLLDGVGRQQRIRDILQRVGLSTALLSRRPAELSGGQLQRIMIARSLTLEPELIICDEAVAALDVSVRSQVVSLLQKLQADLGISYLFITHDLAVVNALAHRVLIMRGGRVVEHGSTDAVIGNPTQSYTRELIASIPPEAPWLRAKVPLSTQFHEKVD